MASLKVPGLEALTSKAQGFSQTALSTLNVQSRLPSSPQMPNIPGLSLPSLPSLPKIPGINSLFSKGASIPSIGGKVVGGAGKSGLDKLISRPDALLSFQWESEFIIKGLSIPSNYIEEVQHPFPQINTDSGTFRAGLMKFFPVSRAIGQVSVNFYEDTKLTASTFLNAWRARIFNDDGTINLPEGSGGYKGVLITRLKDPKGVVVGTFKLGGLFPLNPEPFNLQSTSSDRVIVGCEFSVDSFEMNPGSAAATGSLSASGFSPQDMFGGFNMPSVPNIPGIGNQGFNIDSIKQQMTGSMSKLSGMSGSAKSLLNSIPKGTPTTIDSF